VSHEHELYRILDAAANRAREGLRVVEDYARFVLNDAFLTEQLKQVRHELAGAMQELPAAALLVQRDTLSDVGTTINTAAEGQRHDAAHVLTANWKRLQEALRSLAEFSKPLASAPAEQFEALRYCCYTLERAMAGNELSRKRLNDARLYLLLDCRASRDEFRALVTDLLAAPLDIIQLRDKQADDRKLLEHGLLLRQLLHERTAKHGRAPLFIMNDRPDLAVLCAADGVHVGQEELPVAAVRKIVGPERLIGVSTHSLAQARQAVLDGADYLGVGPTFPSQTKSFDEYPGLDLLRAVSAEITLPAFAIGGINEQNLSEVVAAGFSRIAMGNAILSEQNPSPLIARLRIACKIAE
jgi:thiamine-phosphate pyrophosphorylase